MDYFNASDDRNRLTFGFEVTLIFCNHFPINVCVDSFGVMLMITGKRGREAEEELVRRDVSSKRDHLPRIPTDSKVDVNLQKNKEKKQRLLADRELELDPQMKFRKSLIGVVMLVYYYSD